MTSINFKNNFQTVRVTARADEFEPTVRSASVRVRLFTTYRHGLLYIKLIVNYDYGVKFKISKYIRVF